MTAQTSGEFVVVAIPPVITELMTDLVEKLLDARKAFIGAVDGAAAREQVVPGLSAISEFLNAFDCLAPHTWQLTLTIAALEDLNHGCTDKLLQPEREVGRPPNSTSVIKRQALLAAAVDALNKKGMPLKEAARQVARNDPSNNSLTTILNWRYQAMKGLKSENPLTTFYHIFKDSLATHSEKDIIMLVQEGFLCVAMRAHT